MKRSQKCFFSIWTTVTVLILCLLIIIESKFKINQTPDTKRKIALHDSPLSEIKFQHFTYPLEVDIPGVVTKIQARKKNIFKEINVYKFDVNIGITDITNSSFILFLVKSAPRNINRRIAIRETWGNKDYHSIDIQVVFLLGDLCIGPKEEKLRVLAEHHRYNDIVQFTFCDGYYNNTLKTTGGINWVVQNNLKSEFVILTDDDYFININSLLSFLKTIPLDKRSELYTGFLHDKSRPGRFGKWKVSLKDYPYDFYPPFVAAGFIVTSMECLHKINIAIKYTKPFIFDDVFLGIVIYKLQITPTQINAYVPVFGCSYAKKCFRHIICSHGYSDPKDLRIGWKIYLELTKSIYGNIYVHEVLRS